MKCCAILLQAECISEDACEDITAVFRVLSSGARLVLPAPSSAFEATVEELVPSLPRMEALGALLGFSLSDVADRIPTGFFRTISADEVPQPSLSLSPSLPFSSPLLFSSPLS